jgi:hypothetical protein
MIEHTDQKTWKSYKKRKYTETRKPSCIVVWKNVMEKTHTKGHKT